MLPPKAVFFDFDGVIADTENVHVAAWERTFEAMGLAVSPATCAQASEIDDRAFLAEIFDSEEITEGDIDGWCRRKQSLTAAMLAEAPRLFPGVSDLVRLLADRGLRLAVVSTTWRENIESVLQAVGLAPAFEFIIGKEDVQATKPDPEGYRLALSKIKISSAEGVALEDSPSGLSAARAAEIHTIAVGHRRPPGDWANNAPFLENLVNLPEVLATLGLPEQP